MVKKLAVVTAAVAATLIALSPLASATTEGHHRGPWDDHGGTHQFGLVNLNGTNVCPDIGVAAGLLGVLGHPDRSAVVCSADSR